jgi:hypothetical protein
MVYVNFYIETLIRAQWQGHAVFLLSLGDYMNIFACSLNGFDGFEPSI